MRRTIFLFLLLAVVPIFGSKIALDPWIMKAGDVSIAFGSPTLGIRAGIADMIEIGIAAKELGGYIKIGYSGKNFAFNVGYASALMTIANVFGTLGVKFGGVEAALDIRYYQIPNLDYGEESLDYFSATGEISAVVSKYGNMTNVLGVHATYFINSPYGEYGEGGVYALGRFEKIWIFKKIDLMGGLSLRLDNDFQLFQDVYITFDISLLFNIFRR